MCRAIPAKMTVAKKSILGKRRRQQRVRFAPPAPTTASFATMFQNNVEVTAFGHQALHKQQFQEPGHYLSEEEISNRWYSRKEERFFKLNAARLLNYCRSQGNPNFPRGLERHTKERRWHKKQSVQLIVMAYQQGFKPDEIARLSEEISRCNKELATTQGNLDRVEVLIEG